MSWIKLLALILWVGIPLVDSCSCPLKHPQQHSCSADFVVVARIRGSHVTSDGLTAYKLRIKTVLKAAPDFKAGLIYSIPGECEVKMGRKLTYVIAGDVAGGKLWVSKCHFVQLWKALSPKMKRGFKRLYGASGCGCQILSCHWWERCPPNVPSVCLWETSTEVKDCQARHAVCIQKRNGHCDWRGGRLYKSCLEEIIPRQASKDLRLQSYYGYHVERAKGSSQG